MRLRDQCAIVTGAASGIGAAIARRLAREGAAIHAVDIDAAGVERVAAEIRATGGGARAHPGDAADAAVAASVAAAARAERGRIDVVVTAAAVSFGKPLGETSEADWDATFAVNARGTFLWFKAALPAMIERGSGSLIAVASQLAFAGARNTAAYAASKGAVISLVRSVAVDYAERGIRANAICPGATETPMLARAFARVPEPAAARERSRRRHAMGRFGTPEEIAEAALFLASGDSSFITGVALPVDGGWLAA
jgi:NAD(P)-dependent dehydrogenase (short-subunit alcohol dehydrogenase family)